MIAALPIDYGHTVFSTVPTIPVQNIDDWMPIDEITHLLETSSRQYRQQEEDLRLSLENQRWQEQLQRERAVDYVRTQQGLRELFPNFNDPEQMREQVDLLAAAL